MVAPSLNDALSSIEQRLRAQWTTTPIVVSNISFDPAAPGDGWPANGPWVFHEVVIADGDYISLGDPGSNLHRSIARIFDHVFVASGIGDGLAVTYAQQIADIFRGQRFSGIRCQGATLGGGEVSDPAGLWWRRTISIEARIDELA